MGAYCGPRPAASQGRKQGLVGGWSWGGGSLDLNLNLEAGDWTGLSRS